MFSINYDRRKKKKKKERRNTGETRAILSIAGRATVSFNEKFIAPTRWGVEAGRVTRS